MYIKKIGTYLEENIVDVLIITKEISLQYYLLKRFKLSTFKKRKLISLPLSLQHVSETPIFLSLQDNLTEGQFI